MNDERVSEGPRRALLGTSVALALAAAAFAVLASRGAFLAVDDVPAIVAACLVVLTIGTSLLRWRVARAARLLLGALTIGLAIWGGLTHREARIRTRTESARAALTGLRAPPLRYVHAFNLPEGQAVIPAAGRLTIVDFWATWCEPCREQLPHLERLAGERRAQGLDVVGVTTFYGDDLSAEGRRQELQEIEAFLQGLGVRYPVLVAENKLNHYAYRVGALPTAVLVDRSGTVVEYGVGTTGGEAVTARAIEALHGP